MSSKKKILNANTNDCLMYSSVTVAQNEPIINEVMNRSTAELDYNNIQLENIRKIIFSQMNISEYIYGNVYNVGDLIWFKDQRGITYLLRCIKQNNSTTPNTSELAGSRYTKIGNEKLNKSGWENQNKNLTILDYDVMTLVNENAKAVMHEHEENAKMHPFGKIDELSDVLLHSDLSNLDSSRRSVFFPKSVVRLPSGTATITGYQRIFDKIVEYDVILKLASSTVTNFAELFEDIKPLSANNTTFELFSGISQSNVLFQTNGDYFVSTTDMDIFQSSNAEYSRCGIIMQNNRNDYVNTYTAKITFPMPFLNLDYMVFSNSILSQTIGSNTMVPSANDIVYCDKTRQSITLIDITFPDSTKYGEEGWNAKNGGLASNSFHLKAIGQIGA